MSQASRNILPSVSILTVTADAFSIGTVQRLPQSGEDLTTYPIQSVAAGSTLTLGPFQRARNYEILSTQGTLVYTITTDDDIAADEVETGVTSIDQLSAFAANLTTVPAGRTLATPTNSQAIVYGTFTIAGSLTIGGEIRFGAWPF